MGHVPVVDIMGCLGSGGYVLLYCPTEMLLVPTAYAPGGSQVFHLHTHQREVNELIANQSIRWLPRYRVPLGHGGGFLIGWSELGVENPNAKFDVYVCTQ